MQLVKRATSPRGELTLSRRDDGSLTLRVNGVFVMDTAETSTERELARAALDAVQVKHTLRVLVGGLGLGFTLHEILLHQRVTEVVVAEIEPALVEWHRQGLIDHPSAMTRSGCKLLDDSRVRVEVADVRTVVAQSQPGRFDVILLDVDNGPGYLVYDDNAAIYGQTFLQACRAALTPGGVLAIWSADWSAELLDGLKFVFADVSELAVQVQLGSRLTTYHLVVAG